MPNVPVAVRRGNRHFCPDCGREIFNFISPRPTAQCEHYAQFVTWARLPEVVSA